MSDRRSVWKYQLSFADRATLLVPTGSRALHVDIQYGAPTVWMLVDPAAELVTRTFAIAGTGHERSDLHADQYVGTFIQHSNPLSMDLVWHVFEVGEDGN